MSKSRLDEIAERHSRCKDSTLSFRPFATDDKALEFITNSWSDVEWLIEKLRTAVEALNKISANTYGTEACNSEEENNKILADHFFWHQKIARKALKEIGDL